MVVVRCLSVFLLSLPLVAVTMVVVAVTMVFVAMTMSTMAMTVTTSMTVCMSVKEKHSKNINNKPKRTNSEDQHGTIQLLWSDQSFYCADKYGQTQGYEEHSVDLSSKYTSTHPAVSVT